MSAVAGVARRGKQPRLVPDTSQPHRHAIPAHSKDEVFRPHALPLGQQLGDDSIIDCLLHFNSLGAQVCGVLCLTDLRMPLTICTRTHRWCW